MLFITSQNGKLQLLKCLVQEIILIAIGKSRFLAELPMPKSEKSIQVKLAIYCLLLDLKPRICRRKKRIDDTQVIDRQTKRIFGW